MAGNAVVIRGSEYVWRMEGSNGDWNFVSQEMPSFGGIVRAYITTSAAWGPCENFTIRMRMPNTFSTFCCPPLATTIEEAKQIVENAIRFGADQ